MGDIRKYANNYASTLNGAITNVQTTITVTSATGLPAIGAGEVYRLTIDDGTNIEVVEVTDDASSPTLTVTRGVDGTSGTAFADGTDVELRATADSYHKPLLGADAVIEAEQSLNFGTTSEVMSWGTGTSSNYHMGASNSSGFIYIQGPDTNHRIQTNNNGFTIKFGSGKQVQYSSSAGYIIYTGATIQAGSGNSIDFSGADSFKVPQGAAETATAAGEIVIDTTVTDFSTGVKRWYGSEEMGDVSMPIAEFTSPTDGHVVAYNATNDEFELVTPGGASYTNTIVKRGTSNQGPLTASTATKVQFNTVVNDDDSNFDTTTNYRFTPSIAGYYICTASVKFKTPADGSANLWYAYKNGAAIQEVTRLSNGGALNATVCGSFCVYLNGSTDYIEIFAVTSSSSVNIDGTDDGTFFSASYVGN